MLKQVQHDADQKGNALPFHHINGDLRCGSPPSGWREWLILHHGQRRIEVFISLVRGRARNTA